MENKKNIWSHIIGIQMSSLSVRLSWETLSLETAADWQEKSCSSTASLVFGTSPGCHVCVCVLGVLTWK